MHQLSELVRSSRILLKRSRASTPCTNPLGGRSRAATTRADGEKKRLDPRHVGTEVRDDANGGASHGRGQLHDDEIVDTQLVSDQILECQTIARPSPGCLVGEVAAAREPWLGVT